MVQHVISYLMHTQLFSFLASYILNALRYDVHGLGRNIFPHIRLRTKGNLSRLHYTHASIVLTLHHHPQYPIATIVRRRVPTEGAEYYVVVKDFVHEKSGGVGKGDEGEFGQAVEGVDDEWRGIGRDGSGVS